MIVMSEECDRDDKRLDPEIASSSLILELRICSYDGCGIVDDLDRPRPDNCRIYRESERAAFAFNHANNNNVL
jgi:hypothetical protein